MIFDNELADGIAMLVNETISKSNAPQDDPVLRDLFREPGLTSQTFDALLTREPQERLKVVYFWGENCVNCVNAGDKLRGIIEEMRALPVEYHSVNAYENMDLVTRFGLYGIPAVLFFRRTRTIGKIPSFPTQEEFLKALRRYA